MGLQQRIISGAVTVNKATVTRPGMLVSEADEISLVELPIDYVSRAGYKLHHALHYFAFDVRDVCAVDLGISTGGFTDCLLQYGARHVFGVDVAAKEEVHHRIRNNPAVTIFERSNVQTWRWSEQPVDLVTVDLSFISVVKALPAIISALKPGGYLRALVKPQFEVLPKLRNKRGIVTDKSVQLYAVKQVTKTLVGAGFTCLGKVASPVLGSSGNQEYLLLLSL